MQDWRHKPVRPEPLIYLAIVLAVAFMIFVALAIWWPV